MRTIAKSRTSTEKQTAIGRAKARTRDKLRDNYLANGLITRDEYLVALDALNLTARQMRNLDKAVASESILAQVIRNARRVAA